MINHPAIDYPEKITPVKSSVIFRDSNWESSLCQKGVQATSLNVKWFYNLLGKMLLSDRQIFQAILKYLVDNVKAAKGKARLKT